MKNLNVIEITKTAEFLANISTRTEAFTHPNYCVGVKEFTANQDQIQELILAGAVQIDVLRNRDLNGFLLTLIA